MKLKYYLRGLGVGIVVTCILMNISNRNAVADAKAEVVKVYEQNAAETETETESVQEETQQASTVETILRDEEIESEINSVLDEALLAEKSTEATSGTESVIETGSEESQSEQDTADRDESETEDINIEETVVEESNIEESDIEETEAVVIVGPSESTSNSDKQVSIVVERGDASGVVTKKLYEAGVIDDAKAFDQFLMEKGYDKKINTGTKTIDPGDSWDVIAEKLIK